MSQGVDLEYGARPLKRYIQKEIETRVAYRMIEKGIEQDAHIVVDFTGNDYVLNVTSSYLI